jgi:hypothetical protein
MITRFIRWLAGAIIASAGGYGQAMTIISYMIGSSAPD